MTGRVLVWPWHGKLQGGQIQLSDGSSRPHVQPPNSEVALGLAGPGDTHHILVSGVDPISPVETAQAPPGGEWWAGQALLSGSMLYGQPLDGWIYQGPEDSRWWVKIQNVAVGTSSTSGTFRVRRFGVVGGAPEERSLAFALGAGRCSSADATRIGANLGGASVGYLRLHAVSKTGRTAILALVTRNTGAANDRRPRAYRFYLATVTGAGESLAIAVTQLYGIDDIAPPPTRPGFLGYVQLKEPVPEEISRTPYMEGGVLAGYDVTYTLDSDSGFEPADYTTSFTAPGNYSTAETVMVQVRLEGETPVPVYLNQATTAVVLLPSLSWVTSRERVRRERLNGAVTVLQEAEVSLVGSASSFSLVEFSVGDWVDLLEVSVTSAVDTGPYAWGTAMPLAVVTNSYSITGALGTVEHQVSGLEVHRLGPRLGGSYGWSGSSRQPRFAASVGVPGSERTYSLDVDLLSNNLMAVSGGIHEDPRVYLCAVAEGAIKPYSGPYPAAGLSTFGSYNPVTGAVAIASTPVNWI